LNVFERTDIDVFLRVPSGAGINLALNALKYVGDVCLAGAINKTVRDGKRKPRVEQDIEPVSWCGTFASDTAGVDIGWRWAASAYSSFSGDNSVLGVKPMDSDDDNPGTNHDLAGTPENFKQFLIPGARSRGGKNYTGTYSRSAVIE
jgi:hypothetical protein